MINTIAVDDEPLALELVKNYIIKTPFLNFKGIFDNPILALDLIEKENIKLIFLDIQMPDINGTQFARLLKNKCKIIFTTAYDKYAIEGFKLEAIDYLLKPFGYEDFLIAAQKAKKIIELENNNSNISQNNDFIYLRAEYKTIKINFNDIKYIEGLKDYIKIYIKNRPNPIITLSPIKTIEAKLPEKKFMRVHRSFIINLSCIEVIERQRVIIDKIYIPISRLYREQFQKYIEESSLK